MLPLLVHGETAEEGGASEVITLNRLVTGLAPLSGCLLLPTEDSAEKKRETESQFILRFGGHGSLVGINWVNAETRRVGGEKPGDFSVALLRRATQGAIKKSAVWETVLSPPFLDEIGGNSVWHLEVINPFYHFRPLNFHDSSKSPTWKC